MYDMVPGMKEIKPSLKTQTSKDPPDPSLQNICRFV